MIYVDLVSTVAKSPDVSVMGWPTTVLPQSGFLLKSGASGNARRYAGPVSTNMKCVIFAAVCILADHSQQEELSGPATRGSKTRHPNIRISHSLLTREPAEALGYFGSEACASSSRGSGIECHLEIIGVCISDAN